MMTFKKLNMHCISCTLSLVKLCSVKASQKVICTIFDKVGDQLIMAMELPVFVINVSNARFFGLIFNITIKSTLE